MPTNSAIGRQQIAESSDGEIVSRLAELRRRQRLEPLLRWNDAMFDEMQGIKWEIQRRANRADANEVMERNAA